MSNEDFWAYDVEDDEFSYDKLDPGIRDVVRWLHENGFVTTDSGDGKSKLESGWPPEEIVPMPHVYMEIDPDEVVQKCDLLMWLLKVDHGMGIDIVAQTEAWMEVIEEHGIDIKPGEDVKAKPYIECIYDPASRKAILGLFNVTSDMVKVALDKKLAAKLLQPV